MAVERADYEDLLDSLSDDSGWSDKGNYKYFREYLDSNYSDRKEGDEGYATLLGKLANEVTGDELDGLADDKLDEVYQEFRILGMAYEHKDGKWRSFNSANKLVECVGAPTTDSAWDEVKEKEEGAAGDLAPDDQGRIRDPETGFLYDENNWYTPGGVVVEFDPTGMGFDEEAGLLFDAMSYYTPKHVAVTISPDDRTWSYDKDGNWYKLGKLDESAASSQEPAAASTPLADQAELEKLKFVEDRKLWRHTETGAYYANNSDLGRKVIVYYSPDDKEWSWDDDGLWYQWGELYKEAAAETTTETVAPAAEPAAEGASGAAAEEPSVPAMTKEEQETKEKIDQAMKEAEEQLDKEEAARAAATLLLQQVLDKAPAASVDEIKGALAGMPALAQIS